MKKKILIGSMLILTLLLLMPSIPAIQQKTIEDKAYYDFVEKFGEVDADFIEFFNDVDLKDIEVLNEIKHPILYYIVLFLSNFRLFHFFLVFLIASSFVDFDEYGNISIQHPILFIISMIRAGWLYATLFIWQVFWINISNIMEWNWFNEKENPNR